MIKRKSIFFTALVLAPISPLAYGYIREADNFIWPYLLGASVLSYLGCLAVEVPLIRSVSRRTDHALLHLAMAVVFVLAYSVVCGVVFSHAEDLAELHARKVGRPDPRNFWSDSGMSDWPTHWFFIPNYAVLTSVIWLPSLVVATVFSRRSPAIDRNA